MQAYSPSWPKQDLTNSSERQDVLLQALLQSWLFKYVIGLNMAKGNAEFFQTLPVCRMA